MTIVRAIINIASCSSIWPRPEKYNRDIAAYVRNNSIRTLMLKLGLRKTKTVPQQEKIYKWIDEESFLPKMAKRDPKTGKIVLIPCGHT